MRYTFNCDYAQCLIYTACHIHFYSFNCKAIMKYGVKNGGLKYEIDFTSVSIMSIVGFEFKFYALNEELSNSVHIFLEFKLRPPPLVVTFLWIKQPQCCFVSKN